MKDENIFSVSAEIMEKIGFQEQKGCHWITSPLLQPWLHSRSRFAHKGDFGRALLIAGSRGMAGASVLAARACLRGGAGLLTVHAPRCNYGILQTAVPEAMVECDAAEDSVSSLDIKNLEKYTAVAIGPGLGKTDGAKQVLKQLLQFYRRPVVLDADALNLLAENPTYLEFVPPYSILTPHLGEWERLMGKAGDAKERLDVTRQFTAKHQLLVVIKGAYSVTVSPDGSCFFNTTGNPGMATAGCGDVLTGMLLSLLAQSYSPEKAAVLGVYLHGLAGDLALRKQSPESLLSGDLVENIGEAFQTLRGE